MIEYLTLNNLEAVLGIAAIISGVAAPAYLAKIALAKRVVSNMKKEKK